MEALDRGTQVHRAKKPGIEPGLDEIEELLLDELTIDPRRQLRNLKKGGIAQKIPFEEDKDPRRARRIRPKSRPRQIADRNETIQQGRPVRTSHSGTRR